MHFNGFIASSACVHKIMNHADDVSKLRDFADYVITYCSISLGSVYVCLYFLEFTHCRSPDLSSSRDDDESGYNSTKAEEVSY